MPRTHNHTQSHTHICIYAYAITLLTYFGNAVCFSASIALQLLKLFSCACDFIKLGTHRCSYFASASLPFAGTKCCLYCRGQFDEIAQNNKIDKSSLQNDDALDICMYKPVQRRRVCVPFTQNILLLRIHKYKESRNTRIIVYIEYVKRVSRFLIYMSIQTNRQTGKQTKKNFECIIE